MTQLAMLTNTFGVNVLYLFLHPPPILESLYKERETVGSSLGDVVIPWVVRATTCHGRGNSSEDRGGAVHQRDRLPDSQKG